jgi:hypothetical protein
MHGASVTERAFGAQVQHAPHAAQVQNALRAQVQYAVLP